MQFINIIIYLTALGVVANAQFEKRSCVASYTVSCQSGGDPCCDGWQCVGATEWNDGVCIFNY
ncbi:hypothetical protein N7520_003179 [Penicillium odoratum]|uniref:uncharacterized protein n=1 Tax=Penicillium odoratum TaxID=1167516 RepID=UPI002547A845|nr:uncharacterized protein N7520_003179 [Penicillium odoratum]KAJ5772650.1 hypothetical protein N7520_003179 [Penicillium odoratum]